MSNIAIDEETYFYRMGFRQSLIIKFDVNDPMIIWHRPEHYDPITTLVNMSGKQGMYIIPEV